MADEAKGAVVWKNWSAICRERNVLLRLLLGTVTDVPLLRRLRVAFPECFQDTPPERSGPFPLPMIREIADRWAAREGRDRSGTDEALTAELGFPLAFCASADSEYYKQGETLLMPPELTAQHKALYEELRHSCGFPWVLRTVQVLGASYYVGWMSGEGDCYLYPCAVVDASA